MEDRPSTFRLVFAWVLTAVLLTPAIVGLAIYWSEPVETEFAAGPVLDMGFRAVGFFVGVVCGVTGTAAFGWAVYLSVGRLRWKRRLVVDP